MPLIAKVLLTVAALWVLVELASRHLNDRNPVRCALDGATFGAVMICVWAIA